MWTPYTRSVLILVFQLGVITIKVELSLIAGIPVVINHGFPLRSCLVPELRIQVLTLQPVISIDTREDYNHSNARFEKHGPNLDLLRSRLGDQRPYGRATNIPKEGEINNSYERKARRAKKIHMPSLR